MPTVKTSRPNKLCPAYQLEAKVLELLRDGPTTAETLARITGYSGNAVRERLYNLQSAGYVTRQLQPRPEGGAHYLWNVTATGHKIRNLSDAKPHQASTRDGQVRQTITKDYPVVGRRDFLVSALFGPAHREAA